MTNLEFRSVELRIREQFTHLEARSMQQQPTHFTPFTPAVRAPTNPQPGQYGGGLTVRGDDQPFNGQKSSRICRHYQRGRCTWGEHCRFLHEGAVMSKEERYGYHGDMGGFMVSSGQGMGGHGYGGGMGMGGVNPNDVTSRNLLLGLNQARLQAMRHAKLITAIKGNYDIQPTETPGQVQIIAGGLEPDVVTFLTQDQVQAALAKLDEDERFKEAGLLMYVVGEPSVFYSAVRLFNSTGTCGHARMDLALRAAAEHGLVECMFYRSAAGCQAPKCGYEHRPLSQILGGYSAGGQGSSFTAQSQRFTSNPGAQPWKGQGGYSEGDQRKYAGQGQGSDLMQWDHLEKVVDSLKAEEEQQGQNWNGSGNPPFFAVGQGQGQGQGQAQPQEAPAATAQPSIW